MNNSDALRRFDSLSAPLRLDLFRLLVRAAPGGMVAGELAAALALAPNKASFHLKNLQQAGLISVTAEGRFLRYRARITAISELIDFLGAECCAGQPGHCDLPITCHPQTSESP